MSLYSGIRPGTNRTPKLKDFPTLGSGVVECTGSRTQIGESPETAGKLFLIVDGVNVSHPACPPGTPITVLIVDLSNKLYAGRDIGSFLLACGRPASDEEGERMFGEKTQGIKGVRVGVSTSTQVRGAKSKKAGEMFVGTAYYNPGSGTLVSASDGPVTGTGGAAISQAAQTPPAAADEAPPSVPDEAPAEPAPFDPTAHGWKAHPKGGGWFYKGKEVLKADKIRAMVGA